MDDKVIQRVAMKAVIVRDNKLLLLREASSYDEGTNHGRYHFPGGRINPGEPFADGLKRELKEETGMDVIIGQPFFVGEWFPNIKGVKNHIVAVFVACDAKDQAIQLSSEHDDYQWVDMSLMKTLNIMPPDDEVIREYFRIFSK